MRPQAKACRAFEQILLSHGHDVEGVRTALCSGDLPRLSQSLNDDASPLVARTNRKSTTNSSGEGLLQMLREGRGTAKSNSYTDSDKILPMSSRVSGRMATHNSTASQSTSASQSGSMGSPAIPGTARSTFRKSGKFRSLDSESTAGCCELFADAIHTVNWNAAMTGLHLGGSGEGTSEEEAAGDDTVGQRGVFIRANWPTASVNTRIVSDLSVDSEGLPFTCEEDNVLVGKGPRGNFVKSRLDATMDPKSVLSMHAGEGSDVEMDPGSRSSGTEERISTAEIAVCRSVKVQGRTITPETLAKMKVNGIFDPAPPEPPTQTLRRHSQSNLSSASRLPEDPDTSWRVESSDILPTPPSSAAPAHRPQRHHAEVLRVPTNDGEMPEVPGRRFDPAPPPPRPGGVERAPVPHRHITRCQGAVPSEQGRSQAAEAARRASNAEPPTPGLQRSEVRRVSYPLAPATPFAPPAPLVAEESDHEAPLAGYPGRALLRRGTRGSICSDANLAGREHLE